jgi:hypothetical protein
MAGTHAVDIVFELVLQCPHLTEKVHSVPQDSTCLTILRYFIKFGIVFGRFYNNRGISSLLGNDFVNILSATNTGNNSEYVVITCC